MGNRMDSRDGSGVVVGRVKLKLKKDKNGIYGKIYQQGEIINYHPWNFEWRRVRAV